MGYHPGLTTAELTKKHNITSDVINKDHKIETNIEVRGEYLICLFLSEVNILRYKQIKTKFKNNHIIGLDGYPHYILEVMKLPKKYIAET